MKYQVCSSGYQGEKRKEERGKRKEERGKRKKERGKGKGKIVLRKTTLPPTLLIEQLAIRLGCPTTTAKSLVIPRRRGGFNA